MILRQRVATRLLLLVCILVLNCAAQPLASGGPPQKAPAGGGRAAEAALLQRREPQIATGVDRHYAMALGVDNSDGVTVIDHGGDMGGFHSNMMWWPEQKVGAVILTNADEGVYLRGPFKRRLTGTAEPQQRHSLHGFTDAGCCGVHTNTEFI